ncbi:membrane protein [Streptomyces xanthochromogenes]
MKHLRRTVRKGWLVAHVAVSVSWLGLTLGLLALGITAYTTDSPAMTDAAYRAMKVFGDWLVLPIALLALVTGVVLSLGTRWGLARHRWVWIKFWLTLVTLCLSAFLLRPEINGAVAAGVPDTSLVAAPIVSSSAYFFMTAISVLKPWGLTRRGRKHRAESRKTVDAAPMGRTT